MKLAAPFEQCGEHLAVILPGTRVLFTTRRGGHSTGPFESLNLGRLTDDRPASVARNRSHVREQVGRPLAMVHQVHGAIVHQAHALPDGPDFAKGDGIVTSGRERALVVLVADCLPVVVAGAGPGGNGGERANAVATLHAGWRGLAEGILATGVTKVRELVGGNGVLEAAIGPGIGVCCYEVGEEVHEAFASLGPEVRRGNNLDLAAVARAQLEGAGVEVVHNLGLCTSCHPELFFSHRRDNGVTGRQAGVAWLT